MTTPPTEVERLLRQAAGAEDRDRKDLLERAVLESMPIALAAARHYLAAESLEDLQQVAALALIKAVHGYRPGDGTPFTAYAVPTIHGELKRHLRDHGWDLRPPRRVQELRLAIRAVAPGLTQNLQREPTLAEIAVRLDVPEDDVREALVAAAGMTLASVDDDSRPVRPPGADDTDLDRLVNWQGVLPALDARPEPERRAVAMYFFGGVPQKRIGEELGMSQAQVSRLITEVLRQVRESLGDDGDEEDDACDGPA